MKKNFSNKKNDIIILQRNILFLVVIVSFLIIFFLTLALVRKNIMTVLVPFGMNNQVSLNSNRPSNDYLENISRDIITTMLNLTPNNIEYAEKTILTHVHSSAYGKLKKEFEVLKKNINSKKFTTSFYITSMIPDNAKMNVLINGDFYTFLGTKQVDRTKKSFEITYNYQVGKILIINFNEIIENNGET